MPSARLRPILALVALLALTFPAFPVSADTPYTDPTNTFTFQVPAAWHPDPSLVDPTSDPPVLAVFRMTNPDGIFAVIPSTNLAAMPNFMYYAAFPSTTGNGQLSYQSLGLSAHATVGSDEITEVDFNVTDGAGNAIVVQQIGVTIPGNATIYQLGLSAKPGDIAAVRAAGASILKSWQEVEVVVPAGG